MECYFLLQFELYLGLLLCEVNDFGSFAVSAAGVDEKEEAFHELQVHGLDDFDHELIMFIKITK